MARQPGAPRWFEDIPWRLGFRIRWLAFVFFGPAQLEGDADPHDNLSRCPLLLSDDQWVRLCSHTATELSFDVRAERLDCGDRPFDQAIRSSHIGDRAHFLDEVLFVASEIGRER